MPEYPLVGSKEVKRAFELAGWQRFSSGLLAAIRRQSGLSRDEFIEHLKRGKR